MGGIGAEVYLRRCAEDDLTLMAGDDDAGQLQDRARALVLVGLLERESARAILSGHARARMMRGLPAHPVRTGAVEPAAVEQYRVCECSGAVELSGATILPRLAVLSAERTRIAITLRGSGAKGRRRHLRHAVLPRLSLRDDTGRTVHAGFSGGGGDDDWDGWFTASPGLSSDTEWIEIDKTRIPLRDVDSDATASIEGILAADASMEQRATRYLEHWLDVAYGDYDETSIRVVADTLIRCGALSADVPAARQVLELDDPLRSQAAAPTMSRYRARPPGGPAHEDSRVIGVSTPPFDGIALLLTELRSERHRFSVAIEGTGRVEFRGHDHGDFDAPRMTVTATDDLGNLYRGGIGELRHSESRFAGTVEFNEPLTARAGSLDVRFSTESARAVVHIPLRAAAGS